MAKTATVLGAGIQGVCVSLMLQKHGYRVHLIDKSRDIISRASLTYEGKIHLGFVYGMDKSLETGRRMVKDALHFSSYLEYLLEKNENWALLKSKPNIYLVNQDSMLSPQEVEAYFEKLDAYFQDCLSDGGLNYLGERPKAIFRKVTIPKYINPDVVSAAFLTEEVSIDQIGLKEMLKKKILESPSIDLFLDHCVTEIAREPYDLVVECQQKDGSITSFRSDVVFNCLWESKIKFDQMMGLAGGTAHSIRLKYGLVVKADDFLRRLHSLTMIHGPYGNFVISPHHASAFCSWYPACMKGMMDYGAISDAWERACDGYTSDSLIEELRVDNFEGFRNIIPQLGQFEIIAVKAGLILSEGNIDITERNSSFHSRTEFPIRKSASYYSVSTGKYTSAPRNTMILEQMLVSEE